MHKIQLFYFFGWKNFIHIQKKLNKKDNKNNIKQNKTKENMYSEQLYTIAILATNKSIQAIQLIY